MKKKCLVMVLAFTMFLTNIIPANSIVNAAQENMEMSGVCGENLTWILDDGTLTISGNGDMEDYSYNESAPWNSYKEQIENVVIEDGVANIGAYAFYCCNNLESIKIPDSVTSIEFQAFYECSKLKDITIPSSVQYIYNYVFDGCSSLESIIIPDGTVYIGYGAFIFCNSLKEVEISKSVEYIGDSAFKYCYALESINVAEENERYSSIDGIVYNKDVTELKICPIGKESVVIPESVISLGENTFEHSKALTKIKILGEITEIPYKAFYYCTNLKEIELLGDITKIEANAFAGCENVNSLVLSDSLTSVGDYAFYGCSSLTELTLPNGVTNIGDGLFYGCKALTDFTVSNNVAEIGDLSFCNCTALTEIIFPAELEKIGYWSFYNCINLEKIAFEGDAPELTVYSEPNIDSFHYPSDLEEGKAGDIFAGVEATAYYPENNETYTEEFMEACGGNIEWKMNITIHNDETGIPDKGLYDAILQEADTNEDSILNLKEVEAITELSANDSNISSLQGLSICENLVKIDLKNNQIQDISEIANLHKLETLELSNNPIENLETLSELSSLKYLSLDSNKVADITVFSNLKNLRALSLVDNEITEISSLKDMINLEVLYLNENQIEDITALERLVNLKELNLGDNNIQDINPLRNLVNLDFLNIENNNVRDIRPIEHLDIEELWAEGNPIDYDMMETLTKIESAQDGDSVETELEDTTILSQEVLEAIQGKDITLNVTLENGITWSFNGTDLTSEELSDMDLAAEKTEDGNISADDITSLAGDRVTEQFVFAENGTLALPMQFVVTVPTEIVKEKAVFIQCIDDTFKLADTAFVLDGAITFDVKEKADSIVVYGTNGDTNGDNSVTIKDTMQMLHHISGRTSLNEVGTGFADVDMNNTVNLQDLMREMRYVSGRTDSLYETE